MEVIIQPRKFKKVNNNSYTVLQVDYLKDRWTRCMNKDSYDTDEKLYEEELRCRDFIMNKEVAPKEWSIMYKKRRKHF